MTFAVDAPLSPNKQTNNHPEAAELRQSECEAAKLLQFCGSLNHV